MKDEVESERESDIKIIETTEMMNHMIGEEDLDQGRHHMTEEEIIKGETIILMTLFGFTTDTQLMNLSKLQVVCI
jgi:hypothetical protein